MSRQGNLAKNSLILSIGTFLPKFAAFFTLPILTGYLTKEEYGTYDLITILVSLYLPIMTVQIQTAAFRFLLDERENRQRQKIIITTILTFTFFSSFVSLVILFFLLPGNISIRLAICGYYIADILVNSVRQISRGMGNNLAYSISAVISSVCKLIFALIFVLYLKMGLLGGTLALFSASLISLIYISISFRIWKYIDFKACSLSELKTLLAYSWPMVPNHMSMWAISASDRFIISGILGVGVNAVYAAATKIPSLINLAQNALNLAWTENASISEKDKDSDKYYTDMLRVMINLQTTAFTGVIAAVPLLFRILIKGDYAEAYNHIPILCYAIFFQGMALFLGGIYIAKKSTKSVGITSILSAVLNIIVNLSLIKLIGIYAGSISTLVSYIALFSYRLINVQKLSKVILNVKQFVTVNIIMIVEIVLFYQKNIYFNIINFVLCCLVVFVLNRKLIVKVFHKFREKMRRS